MIAWLLVGCVHPPSQSEGADRDVEGAQADDAESVPGGGGGSTGKPDDDAGAFLYADPERIHDFGLALDEGAMASLANDPSTDVQATFTDGADSWLVGVHLKGSMSFRTLDQKASFKVDFRQYDPEGSYHGLHHLTLNNMIQDGSMLAEHGAHWLIGRLGLPSQRHTYARVTVNGEPYGLYGVPETVDEQFLHRLFTSNDGNLYEGGYGGDLVEGCTSLFQLLESGGAAEPWTDLDGVIDDVHGSFDQALSADFDEPSIVMALAAEIAVGNADGYVTYANNFEIYDDVDGGGRWWLVSTGPDQAFRSRLGVHDGYQGELAVRCRRSRACSDDLDQDLLTIADAMESEDLYGYLAQTRSIVEAECDADPRRELPCSDMDDVLEYVADRPDEIRSQAR
jgi:hypothetical protein